jgi:CheY-like chemotaxis protein
VPASVAFDANRSTEIFKLGHYPSCLIVVNITFTIALAAPSIDRLVRLSRKGQGGWAMSSGLEGLRVLIAEDIFLIAELLAAPLKERGCQVVGPISKLERGLDLARDVPLDGAILDVNLDGKLCFPIAAVLSERGVPFFFVTGYSNDIFPAKYRGFSCLLKPFDAADLVEMVTHEFASEPAQRKPRRVSGAE